MEWQWDGVGMDMIGRNEWDGMMKWDPIDEQG